MPTHLLVNISYGQLFYTDQKSCNDFEQQRQQGLLFSSAHFPELEISEF